MYSMWPHLPSLHSESDSNSRTDSFLLRNSEIVGGTTLGLFGKKRTLRKGKQRCLLHRGRLADGYIATSTPSKLPRSNPLTTQDDADPEEADKLGRLEKLVKKQERGDLPRLDWLDKCAFRQIEKIHAEETAKSPHIYIYVDLPRFDFPIVFNEIDIPQPSLPPFPISAPPPQFQQQYSTTNFSDIFTVIDPEMLQDNPIESKHTRLHRSHRNGPLDRELRPEKSVRDALNNILSYPPTRALTRDERDLVWRFRFFLSHDKRALTKFLKSVVWSDKGEVRQAIGDLLPIWSDISLGDALELLGPSEDYRDPRVKRFAVQQLSRADDDELVLYLLQLVQALKFDLSSSHSTVPSKTPSSSTMGNSQRLSTATITRANIASSSVMGWEKRSSQSYVAPRSALPDHFDDSSTAQLRRLFDRAKLLETQMYWVISFIGIFRLRKALMYSRVLQKFHEKMQETEKGRQMAELLQRQVTLVRSVSKLAKDIRFSKDARPKKIEKLKSVLKDPVKQAALLSTESITPVVPLPLPLDANTQIVGFDAEKSTDYMIIFKNGDDMRQDQLVIQLISLMDRLMRKEHLDLKLTPYKVLATGQVDGMIQFVSSITLGEIASRFPGGILEYLRIESPDTSGGIGTYGVTPSVLENFVRSCAGYCVVTYILGVGDRHLDNLMLSPTGHFFHVDFGYILGRDPKPFPPSIKVCKEMLDGMGGDQSVHYGRFKRLCYTAFICLRKSSGLIINLVGLMIDANIPDIQLEPDKAVMKVQEKFRLDLSEEDAIKHFEKELNETSYFTVVFDKIHAVAQYWRS
ncbi:kinase-like domain-containing protein [Melampsora americana]|nr:kinase-like domain-containing protein [Melampsora americana]